MPTRHRSAWRGRRLEGRLARIAVPLAIPVALAVVVGVIIAVAGGGKATQINQSALANCVSPSAAPSAAPASAPASAAPCTTAAATPTSAASPAAAAAVNPEAGRPDLAETNPVDPAGNPVNLNQTPAQAANTMNCTLIAPANPLSAQGLATPWQLGDGCSEANPNESAFVEGTILAPNGQLQVYNPLVITQGTTSASTPAVPTIQQGSQVIINIGFNGNTLVLEGQGAFQGRCIDAFGNSVIAQTSACNAQAFYQDANFQIARGTLKVPALGTGTDGKTCESTHSFSLIDQDPSDNTDSEYLLNGNGQTAQDSLANKNAMGGSTVIANGSDNGLLGFFVDPALGCTPFQAPDITSANGVQSSQALDELSSRQNDGNLARQGILALLPVNDPQLLVAGQFSIGKTNTYRMLQDQPPLSPFTNKNQNAATFCQNMVNIAPAKLMLDMAKEANFTSPVPAVGNNLATFLGNRLNMSFTNLNCQNFGLKNPVTVTLDGNGVATAVTYSLTKQRATVPGNGNGQCAGGNGGRFNGGRFNGGRFNGGRSSWGRSSWGRSNWMRGVGGQCSGGWGSYDRKVPVGRRGHRENAAGM